MFQVCRACHMIDEGAPHTIGPNLWGVVGRPGRIGRRVMTATRPAMSALRGEPGPRSAWTPTSVSRWWRSRGRRWPSRGSRTPPTRADLIAWLNRNSPAPLDFGAGRGRAGGHGRHGRRGRRYQAARRRLRPRRRPPRPTSASSSRGKARIRDPCLLHRLSLGADRRPAGAHAPGWLGRSFFEQMVEEHEMTPIEEPDRSRVLGYLATHYGIGPAQLPEPLTAPASGRLRRPDRNHQVGFAKRNPTSRATGGFWAARVGLRFANPTYRFSRSS